jgi:hypothetical protein
VHARIHRAEFEQSSQAALHRVLERIPPFLIHGTHPAHVTGVVPLADEVGQHALLERR